MENSTLSDGKVLNSLKHRLREVTRVLDSLGKVYPDTLEAAQVKHEVSILVSELRIRGLLTGDVHTAADAPCGGDGLFLLDRKLKQLQSRYETLVASHTEMGEKRARADGLLSLLVEQVAEVLPGEQRQRVEEMISVHESLWSSSLCLVPGSAMRGCDDAL